MAWLGRNGPTRNSPCASIHRRLKARRGQVHARRRAASCGLHLVALYGVGSTWEFLQENIWENTTPTTSQDYDYQTAYYSPAHIPWPARLASTSPLWLHCASSGAAPGQLQRAPDSSAVDVNPWAQSQLLRPMDQCSAFWQGAPPHLI